MRINKVKTTVLFYAIALALVPIFSSSARYSIIPQIFAIFAFILALRELHIKNIHTGMMAYMILVVVWGVSLLFISAPNINSYISMLKIAFFAFVGQSICKKRKDINILFRVMILSCPIAIIININSILYLVVKNEEQSYSVERFAGTFGNANSAGMYAIIVIAITLYIIKYSRVLYKALLFIFILMPASILLWYSGSRKAMIGALIVGLFWAFSNYIKKRNKMCLRSAIAIIGSILLLLFGAILFIRKNPYSERLIALVSKSEIREMSAETRLSMANEAIRLWKISPIWGHGWDGFSKHSGFNTYSHSTFTEVLSNAGIVGMSLWVLMIGKIAISNWKLWKSKVNVLVQNQNVMLISIFFVFLFFSVFSVIFDDRLLVPLIGCICGYLNDSEKNQYYKKYIGSLPFRDMNPA